MTVNHIDGNSENNSADNLEWVTLRENIQKGFADGLFPDTSCIMIEKDGTERKFRSYAEASLFLGKSRGYVSGVLKRTDDCYVDGRKILPF
jgi:hypothetical protein